MTGDLEDDELPPLEGDDDEINKKKDDRPGEAGAIPDLDPDGTDDDTDLTDTDRLKVSRRAEKQARREIERLRKSDLEMRRQLDALTAAEVSRAVATAKAEAEAAENYLDQAEDDGDREKIKEARRLQRERQDQFDQVQKIANQYKNRPKPADDDGDDLADVQRELVEDWQARNPWFDMASKDPKSIAVRKISQELHQAGIAPHTSEHFELLDARLNRIGVIDDGGGKPKMRDGSRPSAGGGSRGGRADNRVSNERQSAWRELCSNAKAAGRDLSDKEFVANLRREFDQSFGETL